MKILIPTTENNEAEARVAARFGRSKYFSIIDQQSKEIKFIENTAVDSASGAGVKAAQLVADQKVDLLLANNIGPKAFRGLAKTSLKIYSLEGMTGALTEALNNYRAGNLKEITAPTNAGHHGM